MCPCCCPTRHINHLLLSLSICWSQKKRQRQCSQQGLSWDWLIVAMRFKKPPCTMCHWSRHGPFALPHGWVHHNRWGKNPRWSDLNCGSRYFAFMHGNTDWSRQRLYLVSLMFGNCKWPCTFFQNKWPCAFFWNFTAAAALRLIPNASKLSSSQTFMHLVTAHSEFPPA